MKYLRWIIFAFLTLFLFQNVFSATLVDVALRETVNQNVTFAADFDLLENQTYSLIYGEVEVDNPSAEDIYDIYIVLENVEEIINGNFVWRTTSVRNGSQVIFPHLESFTNYTSDVTATFSDMGIDLDEDGVNETIRVNNTHLIVNVSSEPYVYTFRLTDNGVPVSIAGASPVNMQAVLTSQRRQDYVPLTGVTYGILQINGTTSVATELTFSGAGINMTVNNTERSEAVLHIPELRAGDSVFYDYNVSLSNVVPPLDITTSYANNIFPTKVLAGQTFNVTTTASNVAYVPAALTNVNITFSTLGINVSNGGNYTVFNFTREQLGLSGDYVNVYAVNDTNSSQWLQLYNNQTTSTNRTWNWITNGGTIGHLTSYNISYVITAPDTVPTSDTYEAVELLLAYDIATTASNLTLQDVRARGDIEFEETKRITGPQDANQNYNVTWQSISTVSTPRPINYTLEQVTQWVTATLDPNDRSSGFYLNTTFSVDMELNSTIAWDSSLSPFTFNFTDGTNGTDVPIIWVKPYWIIRNAYSQILNQSISVNGTDIYIMSIYVVHGYYLRIDKNITNVGNDSYLIYTEVRNLGNGHTPQNQTVTIYDFVPNDFTAYGWGGEGGLPDANSAVTGDFDGTAYQWDVGSRTNLSTSFSPFGSSDGFDYWNTTYYVNGSGNYRVTDLYIVGLDPRQLEGANHSPIIKLTGQLISSSKELILVMVVVGLVILNIGNFVMTHRISKKMDQQFNEKKR